MLSRRAPLHLAAAGLLVAGCYVDDPLVTAGTGGTTSGTSAGGGGTSPSDYLTAPPSCAYDCPNDTCAEQTTPYVCPALGAWSSLPHLDACGTWDGTCPTPSAGQCVASAPMAAGLARTGAVANTPGVRVLPDGRPIKPTGSESPPPPPPISPPARSSSGCSRTASSTRSSARSWARR